MSRWFRFYENSMDDPKVQLLPGDTFKAWVNLLCLASKNGGVLPCLSDITFCLRLDQEAVCRLLNEFCERGLLDPIEVDGAPMSYEPHNWRVRQYKSDKTDPTASARQKTYRERNKTRNGDRNAAVTETVTVTPPRADTEQRQITEASASGADAPPDHSIPEREYFTRGREVLGKGAGAMIANLLKSKGRNVALARAALEEASQKQKPLEYVAAICRGPSMSHGPPPGKGGFASVLMDKHMERQNGTGNSEQELSGT